jgi:P pilus assembly chaperone PapD
MVNVMNFMSFFSFWALLLLSTFLHAEVAINATRYIYDEQEKGITVIATNKSNQANYLVQSWLDVDSNERPFILIPPLVKLAPGQKKTIQIIKARTITGNDERQYWLNIKGIPEIEKNYFYQLTFAVKHRVKLFYRPSGIKGSSEEAGKKLIWHENENGMVAENKSAWYVTLSTLKINNIEQDISFSNSTVAPHSFREFKKPVSPNVKNSVTWQYVLDTGAISKEQKR